MKNMLWLLRELKRRHIPLLMIYFAYGSSSFSGIAENFWIKKHLGLSAEALIVIGFWVGIPWTIKMVFGQFADSLPVFKSARRSYIFIAAGFMVLGSLLMTGLAGKWDWVVELGTPGSVYLLAGLITAIGFVLQDVVADAMSVEVVPREGRSDEEIQIEMRAVQGLGRLFLMSAIFMVSYLGGWLASHLEYTTVFALTLIVPVISIIGAVSIELPKPEIKPINWTILGGGILYALFVVGMGLLPSQYNQEIVFAVSLGIVVYLLRTITRAIDGKLLWSITAACLVIFVFRAVPGAGPGVGWWQIDVLGFDEEFFGILAQIGSGLTIVGLLFGAKLIAKRSVGFILGWLVVIGTILSLPVIGMYYGLHHWTESHLGLDARDLMMIDNAIISPFDQISMVVMLGLVAFYAPKGNAATWFALMGSFMNLALQAANLGSKYVNKIWTVTREVRDEAGNITTVADYSQLGDILITTTSIGFIVPLLVIWLLTPRGVIIPQKSSSTKMSKSRENNPWYR